MNLVAEDRKRALELESKGSTWYFLAIYQREQRPNSEETLSITRMMKRNEFKDIRASLTKELELSDETLFYFKCSPRNQRHIHIFQGCR